MRGAADQVMRVTLELGGKSANIVFADADLEKAAATAPYAVFDNAGQDCCARSRILVQRSVYDRFLELLEPAVKGVKVMAPGDEAAEMGPLISSGQRATVASYVEDAPEPVDVAFRGSAPSGPGYWYPPTVVLPRGPQDRVWREEVFGPVVSAIPRTLITNRKLPGAESVWSGWATMLGLHSAAPSMEYSLVKVAPSNSIRASDSGAPEFRRSASSWAC